MFAFPTTYAVRKLHVISVVVGLLWLFVEPTAVVAQERGAEVEADAAAEQAQSSAASGAVEVADGRPAMPAGTEADHGPEGGSTSARNDQTSEVLRSLIADHGISADRVATGDRVDSLYDQTLQAIATLENNAERIKRRSTYLATSSVVLDEQLDDDSLPEQARATLAQKAAVMRARLQVTAAMESGIRAPIDQRQALAALLGKRAQNLRRLDGASPVQDSQGGRDRLQQAEAAEQAALAEARRVRARESHERDEQVRELIAKRRKVLEKIAAVANQQSNQIKLATQRRASRVETFAKRREEIEAKLEAFPRAPSQSVARQRIDPLFRTVLDYRDDARQSLTVHGDQVEEANDASDASRQALAEAERTLDEARADAERLGQTVVGSQRIELANARRKLAERRAAADRDMVGWRVRQVQLDRDQLHFYSQAVERLLPSISAQQHDDFYAVFSDQNWSTAWFGVRQALSEAVRIVDKRAAQFLALPDRLGSVSLWGWILVLMGWLLALAAVIYIGRNYTNPAIRRLTSWALRRRFFQRYPAVTIKTAEVLRSIVRPIVLYVVLGEIVAHIVGAFPELVFVGWAVDALFLFWIVMTLVKVVVLPRRYREEAGRSPAPDLAQIGADPARASMSAVDVISMELARARKLVRSVRIVLVFWLLEHYVPLALTELLGHSVITWLVKTVSWWGLAVVVYMVLSTWKDDIAAGFERLARDRLPRSVNFVKHHKDRPYGVLVIAVASIYVLFREVGKFATTQAKDTEWSKRLSNFVFRKRIELQQRERDGSTVDLAVIGASLPDDYRAFFEQTPVEDSDKFSVSRPDQVDAIVDHIRAFRDGHPQGSLALSAEQGMGKTSLLNSVVHKASEEVADTPMLRTSLSAKVIGDAAVLEFVADLFGLDEVPDTREALCGALRDFEPRIIIVDNCHHFFVRDIGGFSGLDTFLEVVNLTDDIHYWMLTFNTYAWNYINRVRPRDHYFGQIHQLRAWTESEIQELIQRRNARAGRTVSFTDLVVTHDEGDQDFYEIIKTANGYFRLLHEFSGGNPMVALRFWKRSIKVDADGAIQVSLFRKPSMRPVDQLSDEYLFALAAIAQHGELEAGELAGIINAEGAFCEMALNYFGERDIVEFDSTDRRAHISPLYFRQVVKQLSISNFLWE